MSMCIPTGHEDWEGHFCLCTVVFLYRGIETQALGQGVSRGSLKIREPPPLVCFFYPRKTGVLATYRSPNGLLSTWGFCPQGGTWSMLSLGPEVLFTTPRLRTCPPTWLIGERLSAQCRLARHRTLPHCFFFPSVRLRRGRAHLWRVPALSRP